LLTTWHNSLPHWCGHPCFTLEPRNQTPPESSVNPLMKYMWSRALEVQWTEPRHLGRVASAPGKQKMGAKKWFPRRP
jgi:hypothetical protein